MAGKVPFTLPFYEGLPTSNNLIKDILHGKAQRVVFQLIPDPVRLATKISYHSKFYENFISIFKLLRKITLKDKTVPLPFRNMGMSKVKPCFPSQRIPT